MDTISTNVIDANTVQITIQPPQPPQPPRPDLPPAETITYTSDEITPALAECDSEDVASKAIYDSACAAALTEYNAELAQHDSKRQMLLQGQSALAAYVPPTA